jgi:diguanylate cyclase (GGDEF)-like protein
MHYVGMSAVNLPGRFLWDEALVAVSLFLGVTLSSVAVWVHKRWPHALPWRSGLLFTLAICGLHFTAMAAASILPDGSMAVPPEAIDSATLTVGVAGMALLILSIGFALVLFDRKLARTAIEESQRLRTFADAAVEGLVVLHGEEIVDANRSFLELAGYESFVTAPRQLGDYFPGMSHLPPSSETTASETTLVDSAGESCDVELLLRPLRWRGADFHILAVRDIRERKEAAARIAHLAYHDALTGLPNRTVFAEHLKRSVEAAAEGDEPLAVLCIDMDGFKAVNDVFGHPVGDELLVQAAERLHSVVRANELVARLGGDEFAVVQSGGQQPRHAGILAERLVKALEEPFALADRQVRVSCSVGVALFPGDARTSTDLIKNADLALYRAKSAGRGQVRFYEAAMDDELRQRRQLESELKCAVDNRELAVHYQPVADLETGRINSFEALLRWRNPTRGPVAPDVFIPLAEECGFIISLGEWVLREACSEAVRWDPPLKLAVNLSPAQLVHEGFVESVEQILRETGLDPHRLEFEVTEGLFIKEPERALAILLHLKSLGIEISMDDFGTGYSSLSYFRLFPFDKVKIDRSFVHEMTGSSQARAIIRSIIGLGRGLGVPVIAEGVETSEQLDALRSEGCDQIQGYLISRPAPISHFEGVVVDRSNAIPQALRAAS